jgi:hypothetical protein
VLALPSAGLAAAIPEPDRTNAAPAAMEMTQRVSVRFMAYSSQAVSGHLGLITSANSSVPLTPAGHQPITFPVDVCSDVAESVIQTQLTTFSRESLTFSDY